MAIAPSFSFIAMLFAVNGQRMKLTVTLLALTICTFTIQGQPLSFTIDSLTNKYIKLLPAHKKTILTAYCNTE